MGSFSKASQRSEKRCFNPLKASVVLQKSKETEKQSNVASGGYQERLYLFCAAISTEPTFSRKIVMPLLCLAKLKACDAHRATVCGSHY